MTRRYNTCVNCLDDYPEDETYWVQGEPGLKDGYYCYECDAVLVVGDREDTDDEL